MLKKRNAKWKPIIFTFKCRRCQLVQRDTKVTRYCEKCEPLVRDAFEHRQYKGKK